ncbi:MAG: hypothetical protein LBL90_12960 [Prevotellaceae bacterium]|jgi:hypothetical protein|nr:hypothetical protein [Prevotellaceae bacterium]
MELNWGYIAIIVTALIYIVAAFIQFRRAFLMSMRVRHLNIKGKHSPAKILSYSRDKYVEVEFTNQSNSRVITDFKINKNARKLPVGSDATVLMGDNSKNSPAIVLKYDNRPIYGISKYVLYGIFLFIIAVLLMGVLYMTRGSVISSYIGILIPVIAAIAIFIGVTEDDMAQARTRNLLLLCGLNASARIRKVSSTDITKKGYKQISFFLEFTDNNGNACFGKAEEPLSMKDYQFFKQEKKVDILYSTDLRKEHCLLNYTWQQ